MGSVNHAFSLTRGCFAAITQMSDKADGHGSTGVFARAVRW